MSVGGGRGVTHVDGAAPWGYSLLCGLAANAVGAVASLLVDGTGDKLVVWLVTAAVVALAIGIWSATCGPVRSHRAESVRLGGQMRRRARERG